jgi:hypothetical protein
MAAKKRTPEETLNVMREANLDDLVDEIDAMTPAEVARALDVNGGDAAGIAKRATAQIAAIQERLARLSWQDDARAKLDAHRATFASVRARRAKLPRDKMLEKIREAEADTRFAAQMTTFFRKRTSAEMTDEELEAMLDEIEMARETSGADAATATSTASETSPATKASDERDE